MKERPILMSAPMVRALLEGLKTQTRRIINPQPSFSKRAGFAWKGWCYGIGASDTETNRNFAYQKCPYGQPGDRLWVKETGWETKEPSVRELREGADTWAPYYYDADGLSKGDHEQFKAWGFKRRPSIFMPRKFSRILLEITDVRVERLRDISEEDAKAEGVEIPCGGWIGGYRRLWESINGAGSWDKNPWVWVIEFRRTDRAK